MRIFKNKMMFVSVVLAMKTRPPPSSEKLVLMIIIYFDKVQFAYHRNFTILIKINFAEILTTMEH